jgi:ATPase subunit of ABC transporter with duplicated ATPase domains
MIPDGPRLGNVVVECDGVLKGFGDKLLYEDLTFSLPPGGIVGVIGPNGAGKTTLFKMIVTAAGQAGLLDGPLDPTRGRCGSVTPWCCPTSTSRGRRSTQG